MTYTETKRKGNKKYYYRVRTIREGEKFRKRRIYLGRNLFNDELLLKEKEADVILNKEKMLKSLNEIILKIKKILRKNKVKKAGIFGSYVKGGARKDSDIDILVEPPEGIGFGFFRIQFELENKLKIKVDLVSYNGLSPYLKDRILKEEIRII
ncbi:MAG: nucleotidyltransferase family protein [Nanoarchaeota archaeon]